MFPVNLRNAVARFLGGERSGLSRSFSSIPYTVPNGLRGIYVDLVMVNRKCPQSLLPWICVGYAGYCGAAVYAKRARRDLAKNREEEEADIAKIRTMMNQEELDLEKVHAMMTQEELYLVKRFYAIMNRYIPKGNH